MAYLEWSKDLELGVPAMDAEHRQIVERMNRIHELDQQQAGKASIRGAFADLVGVIERHFAAEEAHMRQIGFPDLERHAAIHLDLRQRLLEHVRSFERGEGRVPPSVFRFLASWLTAHTKGIDRKYAEHRQPARV